MSAEKKIRIKTKADSITNWNNSNLVLLENELAIDKSNRVVKIGNGNSNFLNSKTIADPRETFIQWSNENTTNSTVSPVTASMVHELGYNHLFSFCSDDWLTVEYSNDGGDTWVTIDNPDTYGLFTTFQATGIWNGNVRGTTVSSSVRRITTLDRLRVTLDWTSSYAPYFILGKVGLKISGVSSSMKYHCLFEKPSAKNDDPWTTITELADFQGWTHWQFLNTTIEGKNLYFGASFAHKMRWTFWCEVPPDDSSTNSGALNLQGILIYPRMKWEDINEYTKTNHLYSFDKYKNMIPLAGLTSRNNSNTSSTSNILGAYNTISNENINIIGRQNASEVKNSYIIGDANVINDCGPATEGIIMIGSKNTQQSVDRPSNNIFIGKGLDSTGNQMSGNLFLGCYNTEPKFDVMNSVIIGNGLSDSNKKNALEINSDAIIITDILNHTFDNSNNISSKIGLTIGSNNNITGENSVTLGTQLKAENDNCLFVGHFNESITDTANAPLFVVGNGQSDEERKNALYVTEQGTLIMGHPGKRYISPENSFISIGSETSQDVDVFKVGKKGHVIIGDVDGDYSTQGLTIYGTLDVQGYFYMLGDLTFSSPERTDIKTPSGISMFPRCFNLQEVSLPTARQQPTLSPEEEPNAVLLADFDFSNVNLGFSKNEEGSFLGVALGLSQNNLNIPLINFTPGFWNELPHPTMEGVTYYFYLTVTGLLYGAVTADLSIGQQEFALPLNKVIIFPMSYEAPRPVKREKAVSLISI